MGKDDFENLEDDDRPKKKRPRERNDDDQQDGGRFKMPRKKSEIFAIAGGIGGSLSLLIFEEAKNVVHQIFAGILLVSSVILVCTWAILSEMEKQNRSQ